ncbi:LCP family protein [Flindersiella endophytica]
MSNYYRTDDEPRPLYRRDDGNDDGYYYDDDQTAAEAYPPAPAQRRRKRNKTKTALLIALASLLILAGGGVLTIYLWSEKVGNQVQRFQAFDGIDESKRPKEVTQGAGAGAINILLAGTDAREDADGQTVDDLQKSGQRSDTIMILHITGDRKNAYLISVPRDTWVTIPGRSGKNKINSAYSFGGPKLYVETLEEFTHMRMKYLAVINWAGFRDLTDALGGVEMDFPEKTRFASGKYYGPGKVTLTGDEALDYVRERKHLKEGDFDRARRQQNYLRALMVQTLSRGTSPSKIFGVLDAVTKNLYVDDTLTNGKMRELALQMRSIRGSNVHFILVPRANPATGMEGSQSVVYSDPVKTKELFDAVKTDKIDAWLAKHGGNDNVLGEKVR